jgi:hypothetical protein
MTYRIIIYNISGANQHMVKYHPFIVIIRVVINW